MTLRSPRSRAHPAQDGALGYEIAQEQAAALGRLGRALEAALAALAQHDRADRERDGDATNRPSPTGPLRERLVQEASDALWCFVVQREACGLRDQSLGDQSFGDQRSVIRQYGVPAEVRNRMGAFGGKARSRSG
jgi:hypothetical protein